MLVVIFCKCMIWFSAGVSGSLPDRYMTWTLPLLLTSWTAMSWAVTSLSLYRKKCHAMPVAFFHDTAWSINQSETTFEMWCVIKHVHSYNSLLEVSVMLCQLASWLFPSYWMINQSGTKESEHFLAKFFSTVLKRLCPLQSKNTFVYPSKNFWSPVQHPCFCPIERFLGKD